MSDRESNRPAPEPRPCADPRCGHALSMHDVGWDAAGCMVDQCPCRSWRAKPAEPPREPSPRVPAPDVSDPMLDDDLGEPRKPSPAEPSAQVTVNACQARVETPEDIAALADIVVAATRFVKRTEPSATVRRHNPSASAECRYLWVADMREHACNLVGPHDQHECICGNKPEPSAPPVVVEECGKLDRCHLPKGHESTPPVVESPPLTFARLREVNVMRCKRWHPPDSTPWTAADWSNAVCGEVGEYANIVKKIRRHETGVANVGDPPIEELRQKAARELADVAIYLDLNAAHLGIDLTEAIREKFNRKSEEYGFPERL